MGIVYKKKKERKKVVSFLDFSFGLTLSWCIYIIIISLRLASSQVFSLIQLEMSYCVA